MRSWPCYFAFMLCALAGCQSTEAAKKPLVALGLVKDDKGLKPPKAAEQYLAPPESETRFSRTIEYPEGTLNQRLAKSKDGPNAPPTIGSNAAAMGQGGAGGSGQAMSGVGGYR